MNDPTDLIPEIVIATSSPVQSHHDVDCDKIETVSSHSSCHSSSSVSGSSIYPVSLGNEDSFDSSVSNSSSVSPLKCLMDDEISSELHQMTSTAEEAEQEQDQQKPEVAPSTAEDGERRLADALRDQQLLQMLADMNKMKRRCKHILDVTDRYCTLRPGTYLTN